MFCVLIYLYCLINLWLFGVMESKQELGERNSFNKCQFKTKIMHKFIKSTCILSVWKLKLVKSTGIMSVWKLKCCLMSCLFRILMGKCATVLSCSGMIFFIWLTDFSLWKLFSKSCWTWSEQVKNDHFERVM